jgi:hypothetical protein
MAKHGEPLAYLLSVLHVRQKDCIIWPYAKARGYGKVLYDGFIWSANRLVCFLVHGEAPSDKHEAAHECGNPSCINPGHIRWATPTENAYDKRKHGTHDRCGRKPILNIHEVRYVRAMAGQKSQSEIASDLGVYQGTVRAILMGKTYKKMI